jgi:hypothetical protein
VSAFARGGALGRSRRAAVALSSLGLWAGLATGCVAATPAEVVAPRRGPVVLPAGGSSYLLFERGGVVHRGGGDVVLGEVHEDEGEPIASAVDLGSAWAVVAYEHRLAFAQLATQRVSWVPNPLGGALTGLSIRGETAALRAGSRVLAVRVPDGEVLWDEDVADFLQRSDLNRLDYALPRDDDEVVLVASRAGTAFTDGAVKIQRIDRSRGDWRIRNENTIRGLTWVHQAESDGDAVFVAGLREETQIRPGSAGRLWQWLVVTRVELDSLEVTELVFAERQARSTVVRDLVVGTDALAVLLDEGTVQIYRLVDGGGATAPIFERTYPRADSIAWISDEELVVMTSDGPEIVRY